MKRPAIDLRARPQRAPAAAAGFSLVELMITVGIIGILAAIAYPSYLAYAKQSNRTDATSTMINYAQTLQRCYSQTYDYTQCITGATPAGVTGVSAGPSGSPQGFYSITVTTPSASVYTITATPAKAPQTLDSVCTSFSLQSNGQQTVTGSGTSQTCWGSS